MYMGNAVLPQAALSISLMQQRLINLTAEDVIEGNDMTREVLELPMSINFAKMTQVSNVSVLMLSDASHGGSGP